MEDSLPMGETQVTTHEGRSTADPSPIAAQAAPEAATAPTTPPASGKTGRLARLRSLRVPRRPRLWFEILLIAVSYWLYSLVRNAVPEQKAQALRNAQGQPLLFEWFEWLVGQLEQRRRTEAVPAYVRCRDWSPGP